MKYLKTYENINGPQVGDYVIAVPFEHIQQRIFFENNIGRLKEIIYDDKDIKNVYYMVEYDNHIYNYDDNIWVFTSFIGDKILFFSKNKADCEDYLAANKYNI